MSWTAPGLNGGPALTGYEVEYRKGTTGSWTDRSHSGTGTSTTITPLDASSEYQVQVRALNGETPSAWSPPGSGTTGTPNSAPTFANNMEARSVAENSVAETNVGAIVTASDTDVGDTLSYSLEGTDAASFDIVSTSGQIQTKTGVTYDHETKSSYEVTVKADDNNGGSATVPVTITVTDVAEQPETPAAPSVTAPENTTTSLEVSWAAPGTNGGPALTGYEVEYRKVPAIVWTAWTGTVTGRARRSRRWMRPANTRCRCGRSTGRPPAPGRSTARARPGRPTARRPSRTPRKRAAWPRTRPRGRTWGPS